MWPDLAIFERSWLQIFIEKKHTHLVTRYLGYFDKYLWLLLCHSWKNWASFYFNIWSHWVCGACLSVNLFKSCQWRSVTRLGDFWKLLATNLLIKVPKMIVDFLVHFEKRLMKLKQLWLLVGQLLETFGLLLCSKIWSHCYGDTDDGRESLSLLSIQLVISKFWRSKKVLAECTLGDVDVATLSLPRHSGPARVFDFAI